jgi:hypothetical protein
MSDIIAHEISYIPSPSETDYLDKDSKLLTFAKEQSKVSPRNISALNESMNASDGGPNSFRYSEILLFSTENIEFKNHDVPMTDDSFFESVKGKQGLIYSALTFNRKHNIRSFDFILTYEQLNSWASKQYKPIPVIKQFKGSLVLTGCSGVYDQDIGEELPLKMNVRYESIGGSNENSGPKILLNCTSDVDTIYLYIGGLSPYRMIPAGKGEFEDISIGENTGSLTYEVKPRRVFESDHIFGKYAIKPFERDATTYCKIYISLRDTTILNRDGDLRVRNIKEIDTNTLKNTIQTLTISPPRHGAIQTVGFTLANDINTEITSDVKELNFNTRALEEDKDNITNIANTIETKIKDAAISVGKVPFIINENLRFHGIYNITDDYFIDSNADAFGSIFIKEVGYYDAIIDKFNITNYFFDFNTKDLKIVSALKSYFQNASAEYSNLSSLGPISPVFKTDNTLALMKSFNFVASGDFQKYKDVTYINSKLGPVKKVFIELSKDDNPHDYDKIIYFSYTDKEKIHDSDNTTIPYVAICDFKDYNMSYIIKKNLFEKITPFNIHHITTIASYSNSSSPYSNIYLLGTTQGVYYTLYLDEYYNPVLDENYHNPFINNDTIITDDHIVDNEPIVTITVTDNHIFFMGTTKFALYNLDENDYIRIDQEKYREALKGNALKYVKFLNDTEIIFATEFNIVVYDLSSKIFSSNKINYKYTISSKNIYGSDYNNIFYNFDVDDVSSASFIQIGQFLYLIGSKTNYGIACRKLNILTGDIIDISGPDIKYIKPALVNSEQFIYAIGGKNLLENNTYNKEETPVLIYDTFNNEYSATELSFDILDPLGTGKKGRLGNGIPILAPGDSNIYIFHPELINVSGEVNERYFNNGFIKISLANDGTINNISQMPFTASLQQNLDLVCSLGITWIPIRWNQTTCEFIALHKIEEEITYYRYLRFKVNYNNNYEIEILENLDLTNSAFINYTDDLLPMDALENAKVFYNNGSALIFCRDKFLLLIQTSGLPLVYALYNDTDMYPDCKSLMSQEIFNTYWKKTGGNKTHLTTYFIHRDEYLVFSGGEGYRTSDYFDLSTFSFLPPLHYSNNNINNTFIDKILNASDELLQIPSNYLTLGSMTSYMIGNTVYIVASIAIDNLALNNYVGMQGDTPLLLLFKIDTAENDYTVRLIKDLTGIIERKGMFDGFKYINLYSVGKYLFISFGHHSYFDEVSNSFIHENNDNWGNVIVFNTANEELIDFSSHDDIPGVGLFPLIFKYGEKYTIISKDPDAHNFPNRTRDRAPYVIGYQVEKENEVSKLITNGNTLSLIGENELVFKYATGISYSHYGFIVTHLTLEIIDLDSLMANYDIPDMRNNVSTIVYRFSQKDEGIFKDLFMRGNYLYVTGGLKTASLQNDTGNGVNNRLLRFYIPSLISAFNDAPHDVHDLTLNGFSYLPDVIQLSSAAIKYFSAYGITEENELITIGDIHFIQEANINHPEEREPFDALISSKEYIYKNINKSFVNNNRIYAIDKLPSTSVNIHNALFHPFNLNGRDFILIYGGTQTPTSSLTKHADLYDTVLHKWIEIPELPSLLKDISFFDNQILGATEILEDLTEVAYNKRLTLTPNEPFTGWIWEIEEFSEDDSIQQESVTLHPYNAYGRKDDPETGVIKTVVVAKNNDGTLCDIINTMVKINEKRPVDNTWTALPDIPVLSPASFRIIYCGICREENVEYPIILLYKTIDKTFHLWGYINENWELLFTDILLPYDLSDIPDSSSMGISVYQNSTFYELLCKCKGPHSGDVYIIRMKWIIKNGHIDTICFDTCGELSQFTIDFFNQNIVIQYSFSSGNLYFMNEDNDIRFAVGEDLSFNILPQENIKSISKNKMVQTSYFQHIAQYPNGNHIKDAIDIKQVAINNTSFKSIAAVFTFDDEEEGNIKNFYLSLYSLDDNRHSKLIPILNGDNSPFNNGYDISFELIPSPIVLNTYFAVEGDSFLLLTHSNNILTAYKIDVSNELFNDETKSITIIPLFTIVKNNELLQDSYVSCDSIHTHCHAFDNTQTKLFQLAYYGGNNAEVYAANLNWEELLTSEEEYPKQIVVSETPNEFANINESINASMIITKNNYLVILLDQYYGGAGEYENRINRIYTSHIDNLLLGIAQCFEQYELPLVVGKVSLKSLDDNGGTIYIIPDKLTSQQPMVKCQLTDTGSLYKYHEIAYSEFETQFSSVFYNERDIAINWVTHGYALYNPIYGLKMPLAHIREKKLPLSYEISKQTGKLIQFTTYKTYIYVIHSDNVSGAFTYYLDTINADTMEKIQSRIITKGPTITTQDFFIPLENSVISIDLTGTKLLLFSGYNENEQVNKTVYTISIDTATFDIAFNDCDVGPHPSYYESPNDNAVYVFPKNENRIIVLPYDTEDSPVSIYYPSNIQIEDVVLIGEENKLKVIGRLNLSSNYTLFDIDIFTGSVNNFIATDLVQPIKAIINNGGHALLYIQNDNNRIDVFKYNIINHRITLFEKNIDSILADGLFKIDGVYERNDYIGLKISNDSSYLATFYQFKIVNPIYDIIEREGFPISLGNQVNIGNCYNIKSNLMLQDLYEYISVHGCNIRFNKNLRRIEIIRDALATINCDKLLWITSFYEGILIAVFYSNTSIIYYIDSSLSIVSSKDITGETLLHDRKTNEVIFIENKKIVTQNDNDTTSILGNVYIIGGESQAAIFQDINEVSLVLSYSNSDSVDMTINSTSIIPSNSGVYRAKGLKLSDKQLTVLYGLTYKENSSGMCNAIINKSALANYQEIESDSIHYITPDPEYINYFIMTRKPVLLNDNNGNSSPCGIIKEAFITSNYVYFTTDNHRYACEINELKQLSDVIQFTEQDENNRIPLIINNIEETNHYSKEVNKITNRIVSGSCNNYFNNIYQYAFNIISKQSRFDVFKTYNFEQILTPGNILQVERTLPESYEILAIIQPSLFASSGYEFDTLIKRTFHNVKRKEGSNVVSIPRSTIISRIPCTPYRMDIEKRVDIVKDEEAHQLFNMAFVFVNGSHELTRDDYSYITNTWQIALSNGEGDERRIDIVLDRSNSQESIYSITGNNEKFPFNKDMLPIVFGYGDYEDTILGYRYYLFIDIDGNVVTFDKKSKDFITVTGYDDIKVPYLSGELTIFPSKTTLQGSIGKRVWGYSSENPYSLAIDTDGVSIDDPTLIS